jgi:hypothetical protein
MGKGKKGMNKLKEIELKNAMFQPVMEDMFFSLD